jgi:hypothetical protein
VAADVVAMKGNVDRAGAAPQAFRQPAGQLHAAVGDAEQEETGRIRVPGGNGISQPRDCSVNLSGTNGL